MLVRMSQLHRRCAEEVWASSVASTVHSTEDRAPGQESGQRQDDEPFVGRAESSLLPRLSGGRHSASLDTPSLQLPGSCWPELDRDHLPPALSPDRDSCFDSMLASPDCYTGLQLSPPLQPAPAPRNSHLKAMPSPLLRDSLLPGPRWHLCEPTDPSMAAMLEEPLQRQPASSWDAFLEPERACRPALETAGLHLDLAVTPQKPPGLQGNALSWTSPHPLARARLDLDSLESPAHRQLRRLPRSQPSPDLSRHHLPTRRAPSASMLSPPVRRLGRASQRQTHAGFDPEVCEL